MYRSIDEKILKRRDKLCTVGQISGGVAVVLAVVVLTLWRLNN